MFFIVVALSPYAANGSGVDAVQAEAVLTSTSVEEIVPKFVFCPPATNRT